MIYSLIATAKANDVEPYEYLLHGVVSSRFIAKNQDSQEKVVKQS